MKSHFNSNNDKNGKIAAERVPNEGSLCPDLGIIETVLWENGGYFLLGAHLARLKKSAAHFSFPYDKGAILHAFGKLQETFDPKKKYRVRLVINRSGIPEISHCILPDAPPQTQKIVISKTRVDKTDFFLYHKTTNRGNRDCELQKYREKGIFDVIFMNEQNEITEGAISNIIIYNNGKYFTPPESCGILNGIYRQHLLKNEKFNMEKKILFEQDLTYCEKIFLCNSVRKLLPVTLAD
ncbi:MAG: aminotransferase class IV [Candidatus Omnitrophica bacterium]|nr:aminotransferase class IV [Candidatus Omnitrophota bacterium]